MSYYCGDGDSGWWFSEEMLEEIPNDEITYIVKVTNNKHVTISDEKTGKSAIASCHPDDTFDIRTGFSLAFQRLAQDKLYDSVGEELKEGDMVYTIRMNDGAVFKNKIIKNDNGELGNRQIFHFHRSNFNGGNPSKEYTVLKI